GRPAAGRHGGPGGSGRPSLAAGGRGVALGAARGPAWSRRGHATRPGRRDVKAGPPARSASGPI
ncbi:MAG: hypothetical protein AVDCRST_MAG19-2165, partial [uncultured Thermomicrobiales bacterium]